MLPLPTRAASEFRPHREYQNQVSFVTQAHPHAAHSAAPPLSPRLAARRVIAGWLSLAALALTATPGTAANAAARAHQAAPTAPTAPALATLAQVEQAYADFNDADGAVSLIDSDPERYLHQGYAGSSRAAWQKTYIAQRAALIRTLKKMPTTGLPPADTRAI